MELLNELDIESGADCLYNNKTSGAVLVVVETAAGDAVELTLHPGASFRFRPVGPGRLRTFRSDHNFPDLLAVDSDEYQKAIGRKGAAD